MASLGITSTRSSAAPASGRRGSAGSGRTRPAPGRSPITTGVTELDLRMMRRAMELAGRAASVGEVPVGAVVYLGDRIVAEGWNLREATNDPTAHAELIAMREAGMKLEEWRLNECTLAVTLEPCPMCAGAMVNARLGRVIYGASDPKAGACDSLFKIPTDRRLNHEVAVIGGVLDEECGDLLREFFRRRRKENKARRTAERPAPTPGTPPAGATPRRGRGGGGGGCGCRR